MKKNLSTLCFAGLVALTGLVATGCGSDETVNVAPANTAILREYAIIANNVTPGTFTIKNLNLQNGTSNVLNNQFSSQGNQSLLVRTHPNINVFYVLNQASSTVAQFTMDTNGGAQFLGTVAIPANSSMLAIHPSGGFVYVVGAAATNTAGTIRRFTVNSNGTLANPLDRATTGAGGYTSNLNLVKEGDFSFGGGTFHVGERGGVVSYPVAADGQLGAGVNFNIATGLATDDYRDVDVRPGQASLVASIRTAAGNDFVRGFAVNNGVVSGGNQIDTGEVRLGLGDMATNGQYYLGSESNPRLFGFNVDNATGTLTALASNPAAVTAGARSSFVNLDPSNAFVLSTGGQTFAGPSADNVIVARFRGQDGNITGSTADAQALNQAAGFDFFTLNF